MDNIDLIKEAGPTIVSVIVLSGVILKLSLDNNRMVELKGSKMIEHMQNITDSFLKVVTNHLNHSEVTQQKLISSVDQLTKTNDQLQKTLERQLTIQEIEQRGSSHRKSDNV